MINKRLKEISTLIDKKSVVVDVGSDHGFLPIYLMNEKICEKVYAIEVIDGPLNILKKNIKESNLDITVIKSDGLINFDYDFDIVVIAGMGFYSVKSILENSIKKIKNKKIIIQINDNLYLLRKWISDNKYTILDEKVVFDRYYYIIVVISTDFNDGYDDLSCKYGPILLKKKDEIFLAYLKYLKEKYERILAKSKRLEIDVIIKEIDNIIER